MTNSPLTVYKASAGSGKTFTLALEYIKLLLQDQFAFEGILAVTFTNKATEEMKMRILATLYGLANNHNDVKDYRKEIKAALHLSDKDIAERSERAITLLLHNYHYFRVQTIDTFFQSVLRNLARELQLNANLHIDLNTKQVINEAVDGIIDSLAGDPKLRNIIRGYMNEKLNDDKQWNIIKDIKDFGGTIFQELYKRNRKKMDLVFADEDFFPNFCKTMRRYIDEPKSKFKEYGEKYIAIITDNGLDINSFSQKSKGPASYFYKLANGLFFDDGKFTGPTITNAMSDSSLWSKKDDANRELIISLAEEHLIPAMKRIEPERKTAALFYKSAVETLKNINNLQLLRRIEEEAHTQNEALQRFMLSDTQSMLHEIIAEDDAPFIFEKIGAHLNHVMIDEFQDTSVVQWANFKTLLHDCMSRGNSNLIVGDVKQSIYRFRSGDWQLLNNIESEFNRNMIDFQPRLTNWRSKRNIIMFNNAFFKRAAELESNIVAAHSKTWAANLVKAYEDVEQLVPEAHSEKEGLVHIELLPEDDGAIKTRTLEIILDLVGRGVQQKDIGILLRSGNEVMEIATHIKENSDINIVSAEAFLLTSSPCVRLITNAMKLLHNPNDNISKATLVKDYMLLQGKYGNITTEVFTQQKDMDSWLPERFLNDQERLRGMMLHDMAEELFKIFSLEQHQNQGAYITTFFDYLHSFSNEMAPSLERFIESWERDKDKKSIETPDCNGVRIMTIHKSKGLEFKHVIMPYSNWKLTPTRSVTVWAEPKVEPFSQLPIVPLKYMSLKTFDGTIYKEDGEKEFIQNVVDNLNLLYVAMTRAGHSLFILGKREETDSKRTKLICDVIKSLPQEIDGVDVVTEGLETASTGTKKSSGKNAKPQTPLVLNFGALPSYSTDDDKPSGKKEEEFNPFKDNSISERVKITSHEVKFLNFMQSNESLAFTDDALDDDDRQRYIRMGTVMHQLFSTIRTTDDIEPALQRMEFDGTLYNDELTKEDIMKSLQEKFENPQVREWFSDRWKVYNECTILTKGKETRPDRVITDGNATIVIDFKFGAPHPGYTEQVQRYMSLLRDMGHSNVSGFLWYVSQNKVQPVSD